MAAPASEPRRMQLEHRRQGSGRVSTQRNIELQGARTGWQPNEDVPQDADGYDDPDAFFGLQGSAAKSSARPNNDGVGAGKRPLPSISEADESHHAGERQDKVTGRRAAESSSGVAGQNDGGGYDAGDDYGIGQEIDYGDGPVEPAAKAKGSQRSSARGAGTGYDGDDGHMEQPATLPKSKAGRTGAKQGAAGGGRKPQGKAGKRGRSSDDSHPPGGEEEDAEVDDDGFVRRKAGKPAAKRPPRSKTVDDSEEEGDGPGEGMEHVYRTPGGTDTRRIRKSLGTGHPSGLAHHEIVGREYEAEGEGPGGRPARRRWAPLKHWAGERVVYKETEDGRASEAVRAEKIGVLTPVVEAAGKRRSRSKERTRSLHKDKRRARSASSGGHRDRDSRDSRSRSRSRSKARKHDDRGRDNKRRRDGSPGSASSSGSEDDVRDRRGRGGGGSGGHRDRSRSRSASRDSDHKPSKGGKGKFGSSRGGGSGEERPVVVKGMSAKEVEAKVTAAVEESNRAWKAKLKQAVYEAGKATARQPTFDTAALPPNFSVSNSPNLVIQSGGGQPMYQIAVIRHSKQLAYERLPSTGQKPPGFHKGALAAAAFDAPEFISGTVRLEPRSVKDLESTHNCTQVFVVTCAQPGSLEVDIGPHTYLLNPGDHFFVPQNCDYKLVNHSEDTHSEVAFVVIKPKASIDAASPGIASR